MATILILTASLSGLCACVSVVAAVRAVRSARQARSDLAEVIAGGREYIRMDMLQLVPHVVQQEVESLRQAERAARYRS